MPSPACLRLARVLIPFPALALLVVGCGGPSVGNVEGTVKYKGEPLPAGRITLYSQNATKDIKVANFTDGRYTLSSVPTGPAKITVQTFPPPPKVDLPPNAPKSENPQPVGKYVPIPKKYATPDESGLTVTVGSGKTEHNIDLNP